MRMPTIGRYQEAVQNPRFCFCDPELQLGTPELDGLGMPKQAHGSFASVYQLRCRSSTYAVRCFLRYHAIQERRYRLISEHLRRAALPSMVRFVFAKQGVRVAGEWYPILKMDWVHGESLDTYIERKLGDRASLLGLAERFLGLLADLRRSSIAHGDLQHGNILVRNGALSLIDYDGMFVPGMEGQRNSELGHSAYQHPNRRRDHFGPFLDRFSAWVIYTSLVGLAFQPELWGELGAGEDRLLFRQDDFVDPDSSQAFLKLQSGPHEEVRAIARSFRDIIELDVTDVPELDRRHQPLDAHRPAPRRALLEPRMAVSSSVAQERAGLLLMLAILTAGTCGILYGVVPTAYGGSLIGLVAVAVAAIFALGYLSLPEVRDRQDFNDERTAVEGQIRKVRDDLEELRAERGRLPAQPRQLARQLEDERDRLRDHQEKERGRIQQELRMVKESVESDLATLRAHEERDLGEELRRYREEWLRAKSPATRSLKDAKIERIGPKLKDELRRHGIGSAGDFVDVVGERLVLPGGRWVQVPRIGPARARSLRQWRREVQAEYESARRHQPDALPRGRGRQIKTRYESARRACGSRLTQAGQRIQNMEARWRNEISALGERLESVRAAIQKADKIDRTIRGTQQRLSELLSQLRDIDHELGRLSRITFRSYIRRIFLWR